LGSCEKILDLIEARKQELKSRYLTKGDSKIGRESSISIKRFPLNETLFRKGWTEKILGGMYFNLLYDKSTFLNILTPKNALGSTLFILLSHRHKLSKTSYSSKSPSPIDVIWLFERSKDCTEFEDVIVGIYLILR
jgi:hypothetical protein